MIDHSCNVTWTDIAGLSEVKKLLEEAAVLPIMIPSYFQGLRSPWKGILLFGPPGTGKTMLAKALATECQTSFFNVSLATITSKWRGESEKMVRILFEMARFYAPSTIFIDEIDALGGQRKESEHEASRRVKTELLVQMDGINSSFNNESDENKQVLVLGATNHPWDLDDALRRRLEKRIYIPLPDLDGRRQLFHVYLKNITLDADVNIDTLSELTQGYSAADVKLFCRDAAFMELRKKIDAGEIRKEDLKLKQKEIMEIPIKQQHFQEAMKKIKSSVDEKLLTRYVEWEKLFGSQG